MAPENLPGDDWITFIRLSKKHSIQKYETLSIYVTTLWQVL